MTRPAPQTLAAAGVLALLALIAMLTSRAGAPAHEAYASTDYRAGGYRAWTTLLAREGIATARFVLRPIELDERIDTLVSAQPAPGQSNPATRTAADLGALAAWVRRGGRLVYIGRNAALREAETHGLELPFFLPDVGARGPLTGPASAAVHVLRGLGANRMLLVEHPGETVLADGNGDIVVRYPLGRGDVIAAVDPAVFTNAHIAVAQNARLAYLIGRPRRSSGVVAFDDGLHGALIDRPWYRALPVAARVSLAIGGVALVLGLAGSALRSGPPMRLMPAREPTSAEFVNALAALYERTGARSAAAAVVIGDALAAAQSAGVAAGRRSEDLRRLVRASETGIQTDGELVASARLAYHVRKECSHGGNGDGRRAAFAGRTRTRRRR